MRRTALVVGIVLVVLASARASVGQGFQGGLRGSIRDAGGGVPGAAVTLTNENTNLAARRSPMVRASTPSQRWSPDRTSVKVALQGYKTIERAGFASARRAFSSSITACEVGTIEESMTVSGQTPLVETANASHGTVLDRVALETLPAPGRAAFLMAVSSDGHRLGRRPVQPAAGSSRTPRSSRSAAVRAAATTTPSTACRSPTSSIARSPTRRWKRSTM